MNRYHPIRWPIPAWTLTEVLIAMSIIALLTGTVGLAGRTQIERARHLAARQQLAVLRLALETYALDVGRYPTTEQGLAALVTPPTLTPVPEVWRGPYLTGDVPRDPWGEPYRYRGPGAPGDDFEISYRREDSR